MEIADSVGSVVHHKSSGELWHVGPETMIFDAILMMSEKNIGALLVMQDGQLLGVLSERDYTRKVILKGKSSKNTPVRDIMTLDPVCVSPTDSVEVCLRLMTERRIRHLPVMEGDRVAGIVSIGDLVKWVISAQSAIIVQLESYISGSYPG